ncbi:MAG: hypothetical protein RI897_1110 [Verrucomicrobiota bacterium]
MSGEGFEGWKALHHDLDEQLMSLIPKRSTDRGFVSSAECVDCHTAEHSSWHKSFHRSMTQPATPGHVLGAFDGTTISSGGLDYRVYREGDTFWAEMPDPDVMMYVVQGGKKLDLKSVPRCKVRVVMTTGSHHYQTYWVESPRYPGLLQTLPLVYLLDDGRWLPREDAFMHGPEDQGRFITQWNHHCIRCHSTGGNPGLDEDTGMLQTEVGELGIACEACHGPAREHVQLRRRLTADPGRQSPGDFRDPIVNPNRLDHRRSAEVCGQCHGVYIMRDEYAMKYAREGSQYHPGDDLGTSRYYIQHPASVPSVRNSRDLESNPGFFRERWWDDGQVLAGGREYTALSATDCFIKGDISCLSCHSMHRGAPDDQLKPTLSNPEMCTQCHGESRYTTEVSKHTFHPPDSSGSDCLNCHMPHTTYALFSGIRSHQISSPTVGGLKAGAAPNACNLCHLDQSLGWAADHLEEWYHQKEAKLTQEEEVVAASVLWGLKGHGAYRVIVAWHLGWAPALAASGRGWIPYYLSRLLEDPYGAVRYVALRSLRSNPDFQGLSYDFLADAQMRQQFSERVRHMWELKSGQRPDGRDGRLLMGPEGRPDEAVIRALLAERDQRSVTIKE